jgi:hypothetical protein
MDRSDDDDDDDSEDEDQGVAPVQRVNLEDMLGHGQAADDEDGWRVSGVTAVESSGGVPRRADGWGGLAAWVSGRSGACCA